MTEEQGKTWGYRAGPSDAMKKEIGQIVINHSLCDPSLLELFVALSKTDASTALVFIRSFNLKAPALTKAIVRLLESPTSQVPAEIKDRILLAIKEYRRLSELRNQIAHWQWGLPSDEEDTAEISNGMSATFEPKLITLKQLQEVSLGLITLMPGIMLIAKIVQHNIPEAAYKKALESFDSTITLAQKYLLNAPDLPAEEQP